MQLLNPIRRWLLRLDLHLSECEAKDTRDDMREAWDSQNFGVHAALADYLDELLADMQETRRKLAALN